MKQLQLNDFVNFRFLSNLTPSPDGRHTAVTVSTADLEENSYAQNIWVRKGSNPFIQLTGLNKEGGFIWDDDETILFASTRTKEDEIKKAEGYTTYYRINIHGGEAKRAFRLPIQGADIQKITTGTYLVKAIDDGNNPEFYKMTAAQRMSVLKSKKENEDYEIFDELPFWGNGEGITNKLRGRLYHFEEQAAYLEPITAPLFATSSYVVYEDKVYFTGELVEKRLSHRGEILCYDFKTKAITPLYTAGAYRIKEIALLKKKLVFTGSTCERFGINENPYFYQLDLSDNRISTLAETDLSIGNTVGSDCRYGRTRYWQSDKDKIYFITTRRTASHIYSIDGDGQVTPVIEINGSIDDMAVLPDAILFTAMQGTALQEIFSFDKTGKTIKPVSSFNKSQLEDVYIATPERLTFDLNGVEIDGWVLPPKDFDAQKSYPAILDIHGGPKTIYGEVYYHEMQYWANQGYFVFFCNPEGSDGRGNVFADIRGKYGTKDYDAIMKFTDLVLAKYPQIDKQRLGETGGSYGGFMTNWIIGHTDRFACTASQRSISNWLSFNLTSDIGTWFGPDQQAASTYDHAEKLWWHSPLRYVRNVKTPTLFIHSDEDYRCPISEGMQMYTALVDLGIESRFCYFKGENHELSRSGKPLHRIRRLTEITDWMDKYLKK